MDEYIKWIMVGSIWMRIRNYKYGALIEFDVEFCFIEYTRDINPSSKKSTTTNNNNNTANGGILVL